MTLSDRADIVKIGQTGEHPEVRAKGLSVHASGTSKFEPVFYIKVPDVISAERMAHLLFDDIRISVDKEYFKLNEKIDLNFIEIEIILHIVENLRFQDNEDKGAIFWEKSTYCYKDSYKKAGKMKQAKLTREENLEKLKIKAESMRLRLIELEKKGEV